MPKVRFYRQASVGCDKPVDRGANQSSCEASSPHRILTIQEVIFVEAEHILQLQVP